jgi:hypothetical protein
MEKGVLCQEGLTERREQRNACVCVCRGKEARSILWLIGCSSDYHIAEVGLHDSRDHIGLYMRQLRGVIILPHEMNLESQHLGACANWSTDDWYS